MNDEKREERTLKDVLNKILDSYASREKDSGFPDWLGGQLRQEMPDMSEEESKKVAETIIKAIADYNKTLDDLNKAVKEGLNQKKWFAEKLEEVYSDMPYDEVGPKFRQIEGELAALNAGLMREGDIIQRNADDNAGWDKHAIRDEVNAIEEQIDLAGKAAAADVIKDRLQGGKNEDIARKIQENPQEVLEGDKDELKAVVAGAVKAAVENGLLDQITDAVIPDAVIFDMAGVAVEIAEALRDAACGAIKPKEAMEKISRAVIAAGNRFCAEELRKWLKVKPLGPLLVDLLGGLLDHMCGPVFAENIYKVFHDAAVDTWKGIKEFFAEKANLVKKALNNYA